MAKTADQAANRNDRAVGDTFADAVRARRRELRLRQQEVADLADVSERFVYALENGKQSAQLDKVLAVLSALGMHLELHRGAARQVTVPASPASTR